MNQRVKDLWLMTTQNTNFWKIQIAIIACLLISCKGEERANYIADESIVGYWRLCKLSNPRLNSSTLFDLCPEVYFLDGGVGKYIGRDTINFTYITKDTIVAINFGDLSVENDFFRVDTEYRWLSEVEGRIKLINRKGTIYHFLPKR